MGPYLRPNIRIGPASVGMMNLSNSEECEDPPTFLIYLENKMFNKKTVSSVMSAFTKTISDLDSVAEQNEELSVTKAAELKAVEKQMWAAEQEARSISASLTKLISE